MPKFDFSQAILTRPGEDLIATVQQARQMTARQLLTALLRRYRQIDDLKPIRGKSARDQTIELCCQLIEADRLAVRQALLDEIYTNADRIHTGNRHTSLGMAITESVCRHYAPGPVETSNGDDDLEDDETYDDEEE